MRWAAGSLIRHALHHESEARFDVTWTLRLPAITAEQTILSGFTSWELHPCQAQPGTTCRGLDLAILAVVWPIQLHVVKLLGRRLPTNPEASEQSTKLHSGK